MSTTVIGIFSDRIDAENAISELEARDYNPKNMSILMKETGEAREDASSTGASVAEGAVQGAGTGTLVGGLTGLLAGTVAPGLAGFLVAGPIGAALGLTGAAATTVSGAVTGAVAGGLIGALMGTFGLSEEEARTYETRLNEGGILVAVPAKDGDAQEVKMIMRDFNADNIRLISADTKRMHDSPYRYHDMDEGYCTGAKGGRARTREDLEE